MKLRQRVKWLGIMVAITTLPMAAITVLILTGTPFDQVFAFFGLAVTKQTILLVAWFVMLDAVLATFALWSILFLLLADDVKKFLQKRNSNS